MNIFSKEQFRKIGKKAPEYLNKGTVRNVIWFSGGIFLFISGVIAYGILLNVREVSLHQAMREKGIFKITRPSILIDRKTYTLSLYENAVLLKNYRASFGRNINSPKTRADDRATPVGNYLICSIDSINKYHKFLRIDYPNLDDAAEGLRKGIITQKEYDRIKYDHLNNGCPGIVTALGSNIGIHGIGEYNDIFKNLPFVFNWTDGSIAITNEGIDEVCSIVKKGTKVVIR